MVLADLEYDIITPRGARYRNPNGDRYKAATV